MHNLRQRKRLCPFYKFAYHTVDVFIANEGEKEEHAAEDGEPEEGAEEVVVD